MIRKSLRPCTAALAALLLSDCMVGPDYKRPTAIAPAGYKELAGWKRAEPSDTLDRGAWWSVYHDPELDGLERQVATSNQTLQAQEAAFRQAVALVAEARAQLFPTVGATTSAQRSSSGTGTFTTSTGASSTGTSTSTGTAVSSSGRSLTRTDYALEGTVDWELDLWGRIRRQVESNVASAQASAADVANTRLSAEAQLAIDYFELRAADSLAALLNQTVRDYRDALRITVNQYTVGVAAPGDVVTAQTQLQTAISSFINAGVQRAMLEHAIAVLAGTAPADLTTRPAPLASHIPGIPPGLPSTLLERRPDIAAAERTLQAENAQIGVAVAAFYPQVTLSALYGYVGDPVQSLVSAANRMWSLGAAASEPLFEGGSRTAAVAAARATYEEDVANYRQTVLTAFEGVEDQLSTLRILSEQAEAATKAVALARQAVRIALNEYRAGVQPYTTVITAENTLLTNQEAALTVQQNRFVASVTLIEDLGGGWSRAEIPTPVRLQKVDPMLPDPRLPYESLADTP